MVLIRADANEQIGTGHVMRCLSIARAFTEEVVFVTADHGSDELISGFPGVCLNTSWREMEEELPLLQRVMEERKPSLLLIDSYSVTEHYLAELSRSVRTAYIDDLNVRTWPVDCLINYNIYAESLAYDPYKGTDTKLLLGPRYTPLREEFRELPKHRIKEKIEDVLVSAGGADPERVTERLIAEVCPFHPDVRFHFVVGALNPRIEKIRELERGNVILHIRERRMSELMMKCDAAVSAAGTTLYELCACGIPTIAYVLADNQAEAAEQFERQGIMLYAGDCRNDDMFGQQVERLLRKLDAARRAELSEHMRALVDGQGAKRISEELEKL